MKRKSSERAYSHRTIPHILEMDHKSDSYKQLVKFMKDKEVQKKHMSRSAENSGSPKQ